MHIEGPETLECPPEFQERITQMFGVNQFSDPNFKIVWGSSQFITMGDIWRDADGTESVEYRQDYQLDGRPGWHIMQWRPPSYFGSPELYYHQTFDPSTGLYITGEYPWRGRYESILSLNSKEVINGQLVIDFIPLSHFMIDTLIPLIMYANTLTADEKSAIKAKAKEEEERRKIEQIAERMSENMPVWMNPVDSASHKMKTSLLDRKMGQIQQVWNRWHRRGKAPVFAKGIQQAARPLVNSYKN